jgi:hypothetical protein
MTNFNPSNIVLRFVKNSGNTPATFTSLNVDSLDPEAAGISFIKPSWLNIYQLNEEETDEGAFYNYSLSINSNSANNLPVGNYTETVEARVSYQNLPGIDFFYASFTIVLEVREITEISVNPQQLAFSLIEGDPNPNSRAVVIVTENNWAILADQNWVTLSNTGGSGNDTVQLGVNADGLPIGTYNASVLVTDLQSTKTINVTLTVNSPNGGNQYVILNTTLIEVSENQNEDPESTGQIIIENTLDVEIETDSSWIDLDVSDFTPGINILNFIIQNTNNFTLGTFIGEIKVTSLLGVQKAIVILRVINPDTIGLVNGGFYFAKDYNKLNLSNAQNNAEAVIKHRVQTSDGVEIYDRKTPYFQNQIAIEIGVETINLLRPFIYLFALQSLEVNRFLIPYKPLTYRLEVYNKVVGENSLSLNNEFQNLLFVNGESPENVFETFDIEDVIKTRTTAVGKEVAVTSNFKRLCHIPKVIYAGKNACLSFSFYSSSTPSEVSIRITSAEQTTSDTINISGLGTFDSNTRIFSVILSLNKYDLQEGDVVNVNSDIINFKVFIKKASAESTQLIWQNQWNCMEIFNCSGTFKKVERSQSDSAEYVRNHKTVSEEFNFKNPIDFEVNTGTIYSKEEVNQLKTIQNSSEIFIKKGDDIYKVIKDFRSLKTYETRDFEKGFNLKFKLAEV